MMLRNDPPMRAAVWLLIILLGGAVLKAHDLHRSTAEAEFNAKTKRLEVGLTVFVSDLELALMRQAEREMSFNKTPASEVDAEIHRFLGRTFVVTDSKGKAAPVHWGGRQFEASSATSDDPEVTLFFEVALPNGISGHTMAYTVFSDRFEDQLNLLHLRSDARQIELRFTRGDPSKTL